MAQRPCVCEGSNENCSYCFGRGFIDARDVLPEHKLEEQKSTGEDRVAEFVAKHPLLNMRKSDCASCSFMFPSRIL